MEKKMQHIERRGLPGGPNEYITHISEFISSDGYKADSPDVNNPYNIIQSGNITMKGVNFPVVGIDNLGNRQTMMPGMDYQFPGDSVLEVPLAQKGTEVNKSSSKKRKETSWITYLHPMYYYHQYKNWGVEDYSSEKTQGDAFKKARAAGLKEFMWQGERKTTETKEEKFPSSQQLREKLYRTIPPSTYPQQQGLNAVKNLIIGKERMNHVDDLKVLNDEYKNLLKSGKIYEYKKETNNNQLSNNYQDVRRVLEGLKKMSWGEGMIDEDAWRHYLGIPQVDNSIIKSKYYPNNIKTSTEYYTIKDDNFKNQMLYEGLYQSGLTNKDGSNQEVFKNNKGVETSHINQTALENVFMYKDKDERGDFYSVIDTYDFGDKKRLTGKLERKIGKPYEIYDRVYYKDYGDGKNKRMYYSDNELKNIDVNKKDFDTQALQRELGNRGIQLPKSTTKDGMYDGIYGDETKNALLEYQKSLNKNRTLAPKMEEGGESISLVSGYKVKEGDTLIAKMGGALLDKTMKCGNCGWKWKAADGGSDVTTCHKCGEEALPKAQKGFKFKNERLQGQTVQDNMRVKKGFDDNSLRKEILHQKTIQAKAKAEQVIATTAWNKLSKEQQERIKYEQNPNQIRTHVPQSLSSKITERITHPMTAISYAMRNQDIPDNFSRGEINPHDYALWATAAVATGGRAAPYIPGLARTTMAGAKHLLGANAAGITGLNLGNALTAGFGAYGATNIVPNLQEGNYADAAWNALDMVPTVGPMANAVRQLPKNLSKAGKFLTEETALKNAYKLNPFAFKPNPEAYYRGIGKSGLDDAINTGTFRQAGFDFNGTKHGEVWYASGERGMAKAKGYSKDFIAEVPRSSFPDTSLDKFRGSPEMPTRGTKKHISTNDGKILEKDWLQGYKQIEVPKSNFQSEIDEVGSSAKSLANAFKERKEPLIKIGGENLEKQLIKKINELESPEGFKRLYEQELAILSRENANGYASKTNLAKQASKNAYTRISELYQTALKGNVNNNYTEARLANQTTNLSPYSDFGIPKRNAHFVGRLTEFPKDPKQVGINLKKNNNFNLTNEGFELPGDIAIGREYAKDISVIDHEINHALQNGRSTIIDDELKAFFKNKENIKPGVKAEKKVQGVNKDYNYFLSGSKGKEPSSFLAELRTSMLEKGLIKDIYEPITHNTILKSMLEFGKNPLNNPNTGMSNTRLLDFSDKNINVAKFIADQMNKLPMITGAVGLGAATQMQEEEIPQQKYGVKNGYKTFQKGGESNLGPLMQAYNKLPKEMKMGGSINKSNIDMYSNYITGNVVDNSEAIKNYDKLNRIYYSKSKELGMSPANYIMTHIVGSS